jgi:methylenetetrahydrofolate dehydrogenase (NADP+)/methenyltetrahydrofolate cyclohydrolase
MPAQLIDGTALAARVKEDVRVRVQRLKARQHPVHLAAVLVGASPAGQLYAERQGEGCRAIGIGYDLYTLDADSSFEAVVRVIHRLNREESVTGIMLHLPLPPHLDATELQYQIDPVKDVEGVNPANIGYVVYGHTLIGPCTALATLELIQSTGVKIEGAEACVVGASKIAGKPISMLLTEQYATVSLLHKFTRDISVYTKQADILVVAVGKPDLIRGEHVREGAVVIDVGINRITLPDGTKKTVGDVNFDEVSAKASHITPVPGGVGPMTVAMLLKNTVRSAELLAAKKAD